MFNSMKINPEKEKKTQLQNYSTVLKIELNLLKNEKTIKQELRVKD